MQLYGCNISWIQGYPSPPAEVIPQNSFPCLFQYSCDLICDPQDRPVTYSIDTA